MQIKIPVRCALVLLALIKVRSASCEEDNKKHLNAILELPSSMQTPSDKDSSIIKDIAKQRGYSIHTHDVRTKGQFKIKLHRLSSGNNSSNSTSKYLRPIILQHGYTQSSIHWLLNKGNNSFAFALAEMGYDVWLGNHRGNPYSCEHETLSSHSFAYWNHSFHEMGDEDVPAVIDYVLTATNQSKLPYIGYSLGTTSFIAAMSLHPEYNSKVSLFIALAPVIFVNFAKSPYMVMARKLPVAQVLENFRQTFKIGAFPYDAEAPLGDKIFPKFCRHNPSTAALCSLMYFGFIGTTNFQHKSNLTVLKHGPSPNSVKIPIHMAQIAYASKFAYFNHGETTNFKLYNQKDPPVYPLWKVNVRTALLWAEKDSLSDPRDVQNLAAILPNVIDNYRIPDSKFMHSDFIYAADSFDLVYSHCISLIQKYDE